MQEWETSIFPPRWINRIELKKMRKEQNLTQAQLANILHLTQTDISMAENGLWLSQKAYERINAWMGERNTYEYWQQQKSRRME